jgi:hypothetical protein
MEELLLVVAVEAVFPCDQVDHREEADKVPDSYLP